MSLRVWLPLNGDLHNQGLSNITVTNNGATVNTSGKIGSCYSFGTSTSYITLPATTMTSFTTEASFCCWLKIISWNTAWATYFQAGLNSAPWNNYYFGLLRNSSSSNLCFVIGNSTTQSQISYTTSNLELNTWYHIACIYKTGHCLIYINGSLHQDYITSIVPSFNAITNITLGMCNNHSSYQTNCQMNDIRIYDHALSELEVKEIARAKVLHYPLCDKNVEMTTNLCNGLKAGGRTTLSSNPMKITTTGENADTYWYIKTSTALVSGTVYTVSLNCTGLSSGEYWKFGVGAQSGANNCGYFSIYQGYNTFTFTLPSGLDGATQLIFDDMGVSSDTRTKITNFFNVQLEAKDHATAFINYGASRTSAIIYDISGYCNNGTIIGDLEVSTNTPKYNVSTNLTTTSSHIVTATLTTAGFTNSYSISWWGNVSTYSGKMMWGFSNGNRFNGIYNGNLWNTGDGSSNPLYQPGTTTQVSAPTTNVWHHFVMVGDGTTCKVYKDGKLWGQAKTYKSLTGTIIYFNGWANATNYTLENTTFRFSHICYCAQRARCFRFI